MFPINTNGRYGISNYYIINITELFFNNLIWCKIIHLSYQPDKWFRLKCFQLRENIFVVFQIYKK